MANRDIKIRLDKNETIRCRMEKENGDCNQEMMAQGCKVDEQIEQQKGKLICSNQLLSRGEKAE